MSLLGGLTRAVVNTLLVPVAVVKDVATLGGVTTEQRKPYTMQRLQKLNDALEEAAEGGTRDDD